MSFLSLMGDVGDLFLVLLTTRKATMPALSFNAGPFVRCVSCLWLHEMLRADRTRLTPRKNGQVKLVTALRGFRHN